MKAKSALSVALAAGIASTAAAANTPTTLTPSHGNVTKAAHIYYNIATGEKVITLIGDGQAAPAVNGGPIWQSLVPNTCASAGYTTTYFFGVDNNATPTSLGLNTRITNLDYGDIALDTVVDMVHINWVTGHDDVDTNSDGIGDGVVGLAGEWTWWDADNGRAINASTRLALIAFRFIDLPGNVFGPGQLTGYTADVDLAASFSSSLTFEIGDSDGNLQGAAFGHNSIDSTGATVPGGAPIATLDRDFDGLPDSDLDGDGLFDWSWSVRFFQPGVEDSNGDGVIDALDGNIADSMKTIGIGFAAPDGTLTNDGAVPPAWTWEIDPLAVAAGTGEEDRFAIYAPPDVNGDVIYFGGFWFGGLECNSAPLPAGPGYTPAAMFEHALFGPGGASPCPADLNGDGVLNFFDVSTFIQQFTAGGDYNGDGQTNFFDVSAFITDFSGGCP